MKSKKKDTIKKRVTSRLKGLGAIMLALFMILTGMSLMPPVEAEEATGDQYWIIGYNYFRDPLFCTGQESIDESGNVYEVLSSGNVYNNGYVKEYSGSIIVPDGSSLTSLGTLTDSGYKITISPKEATYVNAGCVHRNAESGMLFQMKVDGSVKEETTGLGEEGKAKFLLDAGTYAVTYSYEKLEGNGIGYKFIVDFESVIDSLTVTPADATLTFGDDPQTLTVSPASAADKVEWSSEDMKIATVDSDGTVTPVSAGTVTIKATYTPEEGDPIVGTCTVTVNKAESTVTKEPTANDLTYNGQAQELVTAGTATGGTMQYALGTDEKTEPTTGWSDKVPSNTEAGTYYVWYKVFGDENHIDSKPDCVKATIEEEKKQDEPVKPEEPAKTVDMYRLYNPNSGEHFYTASAGEKDTLVKVGWTYEGVGWNAPEKSNTPVYRIYNPNAGDHHYTTNKAERDNLISLGWKDEGIGWYSDDAQSLPIYRQYNPNAVSGAHNFTSSKGENDWLVNVGWKNEGIGWYGVK